MAYYPVNETDKVPETEWAGAMFVNRNNRNLPIANEAVKKLAEKYQVSMPIVEVINRVFFEGLDAREAINILLTRDKCKEYPDLGWLEEKE